MYLLIVRSLLVSVVCIVQFAACSNSGKKQDRCERAREVHLAEVARHNQAVYGDESPHSPGRVVANAELALAGHNFMRRCRTLEGAPRACLGRLRKHYEHKAAFRGARDACPDIGYQECVEERRMELYGKTEGCLDELEPFFESLLVRDPGDDAAPDVPKRPSYEMGTCTFEEGEPPAPASKQPPMITIHPLLEHLPGVGTCYWQHGLKRGAFTLVYRVGDDGAFEDVKVEGLQSPSVATCIENLVRGGGTFESRRGRVYRCSVDVQDETP